jgi:hypothetical protein
MTVKNPEKLVSCKLTTPELQNRKTEVLALLKSNVLQRSERIDGYEYRFAGSDQMIDNIVGFIKTERRCCDFFTFNVSIEDESSEVVLTITGPAGAKAFIEEEMGL